jgi:DNA gyrase subunit A
VNDEDEIMLISDGGTLVRTPVADVSVIGRNTQGVSLIRLSKGEGLVGLERVADVGVDENADAENVAGEKASSGNNTEHDAPDRGIED